MILILIVAVLVLQFRDGASQPERLAFNEVAEKIMSGEISRIVVNENDLEVIFSETGTSVTAFSRKEPTKTFVEQLLDLGVTPEALSTERIKLEIKEPSDWNTIISLVTYILPAMLVVGLIWLMLRQAQGSNNQALSFGKSRARMFTGDQPTVTFEDVAGVEEAKEELQEVVEFLKEPEKFITLGARIPKGVLLVGAPGTGKTLMAKAVSGEASVPFFSISGSEFVEMFVGVGASRVRDLFDQAKRHSPCIVFVDEIDAVGRQRGAGLGGSHDEREQTLNQMLVEMDGFDTDTNVIIIAATNRPDILDPALLRPGRFDRRVILDKPDMRGREAILKVHVKGKPLEPEVNLGTVAKSTPGFVGADLENLVNEAAILAARRNKRTIGQTEFEESIERVIAGPERKSRLISEEEKHIVAYHEAGHAVVAHVIPEADPVHKVSIIARGMMGGFTLALPEEDRTLISRNKMKADMAFMLGGRAAEEIVFNDITSGASNDLERVTKLARSMVTRMGMSDLLGPMVYGQKDELIFLGREISEQRDYSESVAEKIDIEVRQLVQEAYEKAKTLLNNYRTQLDAVAERLIEVETIDRAEFEQIFSEPVPTKNGGTPVPVPAHSSA
ncbi:MAG: cell division protein FtsH [Anaerolineae bacterium SM23_ 63]|nr:MAG: cell division protein FtsH [Anaerolineae bacterium SM23_ 63]HEY45727.1 ATP-dependent metallopeptidase FtsH/Yme1/Tma family protein [Anaerolineae bacterium]